MTPDRAPEPSGFRSLTARLIAWTLLAVGGVYAATLVTSNTLSRRMAFAAAEREAQNETEAAASRVQDMLHAAEERARVLAAAVEALQPNASGLDRLLQRFVSDSPDVWGAAVAFEPGGFAGREGRAAFYYHRRVDDPRAVASADLASGGYRYWERDWYRAPVRDGAPRWSEPYTDEGGGEVAMVTYAVPLRDAAQRVRGVVTVDLKLRWLAERLAEVELGRTGFGVIVSAERRVISSSSASPAPPGGRRSVLDAVPPADRERLAPLVERMVAGGRGFAPVEIGGARYQATFRPVGHADWSLATLYPEAELLEEVRRLRLVQAALSLGGLALLTLVVVWLSRRFTRPLAALSASAGRIAQGDLDVALPAVTTRDEMGVLTGAFHHMRDSLKAYIRDLELTTAARERLASELKLARRIQADMLPRPFAGGPGEGYELAATLVPARDVAGDLFDHFRQGSRVFFLVGDVSGKGVPAALFMARTKTLFEALAAREADPGAILAAANHNLCAENEAGMYVTAVCGSLDVASGELVFAIAGHDPPLLAPAEGEVAPLAAEGGRVLGLIDGSDYPLNRIRLGPRDTIVLYTDGVSEAQDSQGGFFERERIERAVAAHRHEDAVALTAAVLEAVRAFAAGAPQSDDITLLTLRLLGSGRAVA